MYCYNCMKKNKDGSTYCSFCSQKISEECAPHHLKIGTVLNNKYLVGKAIGEGGFGITYVGLDLTLDLKIAIKEFFPSGYANRNNTYSNTVTLNYSKEGEYFRNGRKSFLQEAKNIAKFSRERGIVDVRDFFEENETAYIIMEFLDGENLSEKIRNNGVMDPIDVFEMLLPIMRTLDKMHKENIIHRDISPENIRVLEDGTLTLIDFGSARYFAGLEKKTMSVQFKQGYAPFEQYSKNGNQGPWTDVYGLCATIYKCITGKTPVDSLERCQNDTLKKPSELGVRIPSALEDVLMYGLAVNPDYRCHSMEELIRITNDALNNRPVVLANAQTLRVNNGAPAANKPKARYETSFANGNYDQNGASLKPGAKNDPGKNPSGKNKKPLVLAIVISAAVLLAGLGVLLAVLLNTSSGNDKKPAATTSTQATTQATTKTTAQATTQASKAESKTKSKTESKSGSKTESKSESKSEYEDEYNDEYQDYESEYYYDPEVYYNSEYGGGSKSGGGSEASAGSEVNSKSDASSDSEESAGAEISGESVGGGESSAEESALENGGEGGGAESFAAGGEADNAQP